MTKLILENNMTLSDTYTSIPKAFIEDYMPDAPHVAVLVYIFGLSQAKSGIFAGFKKALGITEKDLSEALDYLENAGLIEISETDGTTKITFLSVKTKEPSEPLPKIYTKPKKIIDIEQRPVYTQNEIERYMREDEIMRLFKSAEEILGKALSYNDLNMILSFYEWNRLPVDVIEIMLSYCAENGHYGMRYLEKVALNWDDEDIRTPQQARDYIKLFNTDYKKILRAFGVERRTPGKTEQKYMRKWLKEWEIPMDIILEACDRTLLNTGQVKFNYADRILKQWLDSGVKEVGDIKSADEKFKEESKESAKKTVRREKTENPTKNRFINYTQGEWDFDAIEKLEMQKIKKDLGVE